MRSALLTTFAAMVLAGGCVGSLETTTGPGPGNGAGPDAGQTAASTAKPLFDQNVYPIVKAKCAGCHSSTGPSGNVTGFVSPDAATGYVTLTGYTAVVGNFTTSAALLSKIAAGHQGQSYTADEISKITAWLEKEASDRSGAPVTGADASPGSESPSAATERLLKQWSGCMSLTNFNTATMADAWGNMNTTNNQQCENCHVNGAEGFIASRVPEPFFNTISANKYYMLQYFTVDLTQGTANAKIIINTTSFDGVSKGQDPHREHPRFNSTTNQGMTALQSFYDLTMARLTAGTCDPPRLTN